MYGAEAVLPPEIKLNAPRVEVYNEDEAKESQEDALDVLDEARDTALARTTVYHQDLRSYHSRRLRPRTFMVGDLVLRLK